MLAMQLTATDNVFNSCRWDTLNDPSAIIALQREFAFSPWLIITFCVTFIFVYLWGEAKNDYDNFDW